ncbi:hypothetical protein ZWY2020_047167 [Hordeum vulgare]|nr:hypothetical protein ZWY2020_047167 [Hordeum vulgare]
MGGQRVAGIPTASPSRSSTDLLAEAPLPPPPPPPSTRLFVAKYKELVQYQVMEGSKNMEESDTASVVKVYREPAIIINGVPDLPPDFASGSQPSVRDAPGSRVDHRFGEWLEGRKVRKQFGDKCFAGKVVKYDSESNWYSVVYDDGDQEDLEWLELEEILLPLDITIPLRTLVMDKFKHQNPDYRLKVARSSQGTNVASNQMVVRAVNGQQSKNPPLPGLLQPSPSNAETVRAEKLKMQSSKRKTEDICLSIPVYACW